MKIKYFLPPSESKDALNEGIRFLSLNANSLLNEKISEIVTSPEQFFPHESFFIKLEDIASGKGLITAKSSGWQYLIRVSENEVFSLELHSDQEKKLFTFSGINFSKFNKSTIDFLEAKEASNEEANGNYRVATIVIPVLYVYAIWLRDTDTNKDIIIPLAPTHPKLRSGDPYLPDAFFKILEPEAKNILNLEETMLE